MSACAGSPTPGLAPRPPGAGPLVMFDLDARPLPEIPLPNDLATRPDPTSPTGRRVNTSLLSPSFVESRFRERLNRLSGFSTFAPITVRFDAPLDIDNLLRRHGKDLGREDDAVYLVNLATGEAVYLDLGGGAYPYLLERPDRYYPNDSRAGESNLVFETVNEDVNANGRLDPGEDTDSDGVRDLANTSVLGGDPIDDLLTFYERETNTLILRPLVPLEPETAYAVVLTNRLTSELGEPVRSPFAFINHTQQTEDLKPLVGILPELAPGLTIDDVAFCWSFTTQSTTRDLEDLRMGLYGKGPFARLARQFPPETQLECAYDDPGQAAINPFVIPAEEIVPALKVIAGWLLGDQAVVDAVGESFRFMDYLVLGRAQTPLLLEGLEGIFELDATSGRMSVSSQDLPWLLAVPKERPEWGITAPFPVAIYVHGTGGSRLEALGFAGQLAKFGIATVGLEAVMCGLVVPADLESWVIETLGAYGFGAVARAFLDNRTVDINRDGVKDPSGNFWTYEAFRSRDSIRQSVLDVLRLVQVLRGFDGVRTWSLDADGDGVADLEGRAGDFDQDGEVDLVGRSGPYFLFGISLGGIVSSIAAAVEPEIIAAAPISSGGGLIDIAVRSLQRGVPEMVVLPVMGPLILGTRDPAGGEPVLSFYVPDGRSEVAVAVHALAGLRPGDRVGVVNLRNGEEDWSRADQNLAFRLAVPCDREDPLRVMGLDPAGGAVVWEADHFDRNVEWQGTGYPAGSRLVALAEGFGVRRQSPAFRRFLQIAQTALDAGDPINYARNYREDPLYRNYPGVGRTTRLALLLTVGDMNVPISTGVSLARAAGLIPYRPGEIDSRFGETPHRVLVDSYVLEGLERLRRFDTAPWFDPREILLDPDYLAEGTDGFNAPALSRPLRLLTPGPGVGVSLVRFLYPSPRGTHGIGPSDPTLPFNVDLYGINAIGRYFQTLGREWVDHLCLADDSCPFIPLE